MFRNVLAAALRNLMRNRLYTAISIGGLAIGMAAALLAALFIRDELTFDSFVPGHERALVMHEQIFEPGTAPVEQNWSVAYLAGWLKLDVPGIAEIARVAPDGAVPVRRGDQEQAEVVAWVDPNFFRLLPYPAIAGDPVRALERPDAVVITRAMARKYFGQDKPIGQTLQLRRSLSLRVTAVLEDYPGSTNQTAEIYASGQAAMSPLAKADATPFVPGKFNNDTRTFLRLKDSRGLGAFNAALPTLVSRRILTPEIKKLLPQGTVFRLAAVPIGRMHLLPDIGSSTPPTSPAVLAGLGALAGLVLLVAGINFVNLMTARAARRALEVGIRKVSGASRGRLMLQFIGEAVLYAFAAAICAAALVELSLPALNGLMLRHIAFSYWRDPQLLLFSLGLTVIVALAAGAYPAFVLSSFRPATALKGSLPQTSGSAAVRQGLVTVQFAVLILLVFGVLVIQGQTRFALKTAAGIDKDSLLAIRVDPPCRGAFADAVAKLPGVRSVRCTSGRVLGMGGSSERSVDLPDGRTATFRSGSVDFGTLEQLGLKPLAGRFPAQGHPEDALAYDPAVKECFRFGTDVSPAFPRTAVINRSAVRAMGLGAPEQAIGKVLRVRTSLSQMLPVQVVGVVPDFAIDLTHGPINPTFYSVDANCLGTLTVKIEPRALGETVPAIGRLWKQLGPPRPISEIFVDDFMRRALYAGSIRQGTGLLVLAGVAVLVGALGLFALAAFTAERRTKEIGVRKVLGASTADIVRLLLWQFTRPVLLANLIAWPLGWWALDRWLQGFSQRISLSPLLFLLAGGAALVIAAVTVSGHALRVASAKPVGALRYE